ncbi:MAG: insulinase family protein, partial [Actinobacteria bacterium]|nr:insulinase family protein [Actinomycetota bacterium]
MDETVPTRGITHLVEHLALSSLGDRPYGHNGQVELTKTRFMASGTPEQVSDFVRTVTTNLLNPPLDRLDQEKRILRIEAVNRNQRSPKGVLSWRYGAGSLGLADYEEFGLRWLTADWVQHWAHLMFNSANAVLWIAGNLPSDLEITLPIGEKHAQGPCNPLPYGYPAQYHEGDRWTALSMTGARSLALVVGGYVLDRRVRQKIRFQEAIAYDVGASYNAISPNEAELRLVSDALAANAPAAALAMVECVRDV